MELQAIPGARTTVMSNISILMLFLKNPLKGAERPNTGTLINVSCSISQTLVMILHSSLCV